MLAANSGEMTESITFVRSTRTKRADGGYDVADTTLAEVFAAMKPTRGAEVKEAGRLIGYLSYDVWLYLDDVPEDLTTDDRVVWASEDGDVAFNIRAIEIGRGDDLATRIVCDKGVQL